MVFDGYVPFSFDGRARRRTKPELGVLGSCFLFAANGETLIRDERGNAK